MKLQNTPQNGIVPPWARISAVTVTEIAGAALKHTVEGGQENQGAKMLAGTHQNPVFPVFLSKILYFSYLPLYLSLSIFFWGGDIFLTLL